jgi:hypothetical protein
MASNGLTALYAVSANESNVMSYEKSKEPERYEALVQALSADLRPVRRLWPPVLLALSWLGVVVVIAAAMACSLEAPTVTQQLATVPDMQLAMIGSALTTALAAVAAFQLSFPDRSPLWALLPVPAAILWIGASGMGCLRTWLLPGAHDAFPSDRRICLFFILGLSVPLSALLFKMLQRAYSLRPGLTGSTGGLAVAGASATVLSVSHPYDAAASDLVVHVLAVAIVVIANWAHIGGYPAASPIIWRRGDRGSPTNSRRCESRGGTARQRHPKC